jgi:hypothetical protein
MAAMVDMTDKEVKKYHGFYLWLRYDLLTVPDTKPKVWSAFKHYALDDGDMPNSFMDWGTSPLIQADDMDMMKCETAGDPIVRPDGSTVQQYTMNWYGFTVPTKGKELIYLEPGLMSDADSAMAREMLEVTVLHELVHWCRKVRGKDVFDEDPCYAFERDAYGKAKFDYRHACKSEVYWGKRRDRPRVEVD